MVHMLGREEILDKSCETFPSIYKMYNTLKCWYAMLENSEQLTF